MTPPFGYRDKFAQARTEALTAQGEAPEDEETPEDLEDHRPTQTTTEPARADFAAQVTPPDAGEFYANTPAGTAALEEAGLTPTEDAPTLSGVDAFAAGPTNSGEEAPA